MSSADPRSRWSSFEKILRESDVDPNPVRQFHQWYADAAACGMRLPEAMVLATAGPDGQPSARTVLMRAFDERGVVFFTNYDSRKGRALAANPRAALVFFWEPLERQVLVQGHVEKTTAAESDAYHESRPRDSRLGAWASPQSQVLPSRELLDQRMEEITAQFAGQEMVPRPPYWGGFRVIPETVEFWQGQPNRLHDRIVYRWQSDGTWVIGRLAP